MATLETNAIQATSGVDVAVNDNLDVNGNLDVSGSVTLAADALSGDAIDGGTISDFASEGIDDNSNGTTGISIIGNGNVTVETDLTVDVNAGITGTLDVTGQTTVQNLDVQGTVAGIGIVATGMWGGTVTMTTSGGGYISTITSITDDTDEGVVASAAVSGGALRITFTGNIGVAYLAIVTVSNNGDTNPIRTMAITETTGYVDVGFRGEEGTIATVRVLIMDPS